MTAAAAAAAAAAAECVPGTLRGNILKVVVVCGCVDERR